MSDQSEQISRIIASMKGLAGTGNVLSAAVDKIEGLVATMEPGDFVRSDTNTASAAPVSADLWYLFTTDNFLSYYDKDPDLKHQDYKKYITDSLSFLPAKLKPMRALKDLAQLIPTTVTNVFAVFDMWQEWANEGEYWVTAMAFELINKDKKIQNPSDGPKGYKPNDYVGYLSFPIGQLGVMEVISLIQETKLRGYKLGGLEIHVKDTLKYTETPVSCEKAMFPPENYAGLNYCYGKHLVESGYRVPDEVIKETPEQSPVSRDVEIFASKDDRAEDIKPKKWFRYWINKDSKIPVPGEFVGIVVKPTAIPPHVWWFQESTPLLYAGNWVETVNLTSGHVKSVKLEADRGSGVGNEYEVEVQGVVVKIYSTDFYLYAVGDRVAIVKIDSILTWPDKSFTWKNQTVFKKADKDTVKTNYVIIPAVFYR